LSPPGFQNHGLAYDTRSDRVILFGGGDAHLEDSRETWVYNFNNNSWINETSSISPSPRRRFSMVYDEESDRTILFGGCHNGFTHSDETWAYHYQSHEELTVDTTTTDIPSSTSTSEPSQGTTPSFTLAIVLLTVFTIFIYHNRWKKTKNS
ncbi:MAG: hypothetical protein JSV04_09425, partial [Candidatus Heimdallarchaeota archaeon]